MLELESALSLGQVVLLGLLGVLGLHKAWTILMLARGRRTAPPTQDPEELPRICVQLPVYNERFVVAGLLEAVAALDYPRDRLRVQVLDDSDDETSKVISETLAGLPADLQVEHLQRGRREGFKAGALAYGLERDDSELVAIFDADFLPPPQFLRRCLPHFADPRVGLVQGRWEHSNRDASLLTQTQALLLDGHFLVEQPARARNGCLFNFNGTAGLWRRSCIEAAGGWQQDTLTEDLDLSYRAQLAGWRFVYRDDLACPAQLPTEANGFLNQQQRWARGSIQCGRKLIGQVLSAPIPLRCRIEACFHLYGNLAFPLLLLLILSALPLQALRYHENLHTPAFLHWLESLPLLLASLSVLAYFGLSQLRLRRLDLPGLLRLPLVLVVGAGLALNNSIAVLRGLRRNTGVFVRTPKHRSSAEAAAYRSARGWLPVAEVLLGCYAAGTVVYASLLGQVSTALFHGLFALGLLWLGGASLRCNRRSRAVLPVVLLAGCSGSGGGTTVPIKPPADALPTLAAARSWIGREHGDTEVVFSSAQGLGYNDLSKRSGQETGVRFHPDGKRLVFARERRSSQEDSRELYIASVDGSSAEVRLTGNGYLDDDPTVAPDGSELIYSSQPGSYRELWRCMLDGSNPRRLTAGNFADRYPDWHASSGVAFSRAEVAPGTGPARIMRMDPDGANIIQLSDGGSGIGDIHPAWSPDGSQLLFVRQFSADRAQLMLLEPGSGTLTPLGDGTGLDAHPRWSPQADRIYLCRSRPGLGSPGLRIYSCAPDGSEPLLLYPDERFAYPGLDLSPTLPAWIAPLNGYVLQDTAAGDLERRLGRLTQGVREDVNEVDGKALGLSTVSFERRERAGVELRILVPTSDPNRVSSLRVTVHAAISRFDGDSLIRLALHNALAQRNDTVVEWQPGDDKLQVLSFETQSLAHLDRNGQLRLEVVGDLEEGDPAELFIDYIGVAVRLRPE